MTKAEIRLKIRQFLAQHFRNHDDLQDDDDIFKLGFVSSLFAMQLVVFVEREFELTMEDQDLELDHFRTINALTALVMQKRGS